MMAPREIASLYTKAFGDLAVYVGGGWIRVCSPIGASEVLRTTDALRRAKKRLASREAPNTCVGALSGEGQQ